MFSIRISDKFTERLSSIFADVAQVLFASIVITPILNYSSTSNIIMGVGATLIVWSFSLILSYKQDKILVVGKPDKKGSIILVIEYKKVKSLPSK